MAQRCLKQAAAGFCGGHSSAAPHYHPSRRHQQGQWVGCSSRARAGGLCSNIEPASTRTQNVYRHQRNGHGVVVRAGEPAWCRELMSELVCAYVDHVSNDCLLVQSQALRALQRPTHGTNRSITGDCGCSRSSTAPQHRPCLLTEQLLFAGWNLSRIPMDRLPLTRHHRSGEVRMIRTCPSWF